MDTLREVLREEDSHQSHQGYVAVRAHSQSHGRGRRGRSWHGAEGNLFLSVSLPYKEDPSRAFELSFVSALALEKTVRVFCPGAPLVLKWPNDLLLGNKKLGGLLIEDFACNGLSYWLVGLGLNLKDAPFLEGGSYQAAGLGDIMDSPPVLQDVTEVFLKKFSCEVAKRAQEGFEPLRKQWLQRTFQPGTPLTLSTDRGSFTGPFLDLDRQGRLLLGTSYETAQAFSVGDVVGPEENGP